MSYAILKLLPQEDNDEVILLVLVHATLQLMLLVIHLVYGFMRELQEKLSQHESVTKEICHTIDAEQGIAAFKITESNTYRLFYSQNLKLVTRNDLHMYEEFSEEQLIDILKVPKINDFCSDYCFSKLIENSKQEDSEIRRV